MSSRLYKEALADAKLLKEMAKQVAQQELVEKHSSEFKNLLLSKLFEQEDKQENQDLLLDEEEDSEGGDSDNLNIDDFDAAGSGGGETGGEPGGMPELGGEPGGEEDSITGDFNSSEPTETVKAIPFAVLDNKGLSESAEEDELVEIDLDGITPESEDFLGNSDKNEPIASGSNNIDIKVNQKNKKEIKDKEPEQNVKAPETDSTEDIKESITISKDDFILYLEKDLMQEERINNLEDNIKKIIKENNKQRDLLTTYEKQLNQTNKKLQESIKLEYKFNILADSSLSGRQKNGLIEAIDKTKDIKSIGTLVEAFKNNIIKEVKNNNLNDIKNKKQGSTFFVTKTQPLNESKESEGWGKFRELAGIQGKN